MRIIKPKFQRPGQAAEVSCFWHSARLDALHFQDPRECGLLVD
jgi:hypothetical protein